MWKRVSYHDVAWNRQTRVGAIRLTFDDRSAADLRDLSIEELALICNMLRAEKPLYYDEERQRLTTDVAYPDAEA